MLQIGTGLYNLGNTCFLNSVTQCLLHAPEFAKMLQLKTHSKQCKSNKWCSFCQMEVLWAMSKSSKRPSNPQSFVGNVDKFFKKYRRGRQQDSHEFLRYLIDNLQRCEIGFAEKQPAKIRALTQKSEIFRIFGAKIKSSIECKECRKKSEIVEDAYDILLECLQSKSVMESLERFFKVDWLTGKNQYKCENCRKLCDASKRFLLNKLPEVLTIQLKRFTFNRNMNKINKFVKYETSMNLAKFCEKLMPAQYDLFGVVVHQGHSCNSGHYYSYVRQPSGNNWYIMNDQSVKSASLDSVLSQNSYLLFYKLRKPVENINIAINSTIGLLKRESPESTTIDQQSAQVQKSEPNVPEKTKCPTPKSLQPQQISKPPAKKSFAEELQMVLKEKTLTLGAMRRYFSIEQKNQQQEGKTRMMEIEQQAKQQVAKQHEQPEQPKSNCNGNAQWQTIYLNPLKMRYVRRIMWLKRAIRRKKRLNFTQQI